MSFKGKKKTKSVYCPAAGYDLYAPLYDEDYNYLRSFEKDQLFHTIGDISGKEVLDLGCGTGRIIGELKLLGAKITACDISKKMIELTRKKYPDLKLVKADANNLPFEEDLFDFVVAAFLIVHTRKPEKVFGEVYRVLKPEGQFILSNINQKKAPRLKLKTGEKIVIKSYYHRPEDVIKALESQFFKIEREYFVKEGNTWINQIVKARKF